MAAPAAPSVFATGVATQPVVLGAAAPVIKRTKKPKAAKHPKGAKHSKGSKRAKKEAGHALGAAAGAPVAVVATTSAGWSWGMIVGVLVLGILVILGVMYAISSLGGEYSTKGTSGAPQKTTTYTSSMSTTSIAVLAIFLLALAALAVFFGVRFMRRAPASTGETPAGGSPDKGPATTGGDTGAGTGLLPPEAAAFLRKVALLRNSEQEITGTVERWALTENTPEEARRTFSQDAVKLVRFAQDMRSDLVQARKHATQTGMADAIAAATKYEAFMKTLSIEELRKIEANEVLSSAELADFQTKAAKLRQ